MNKQTKKMAKKPANNIQPTELKGNKELQQMLKGLSGLKVPATKSKSEAWQTFIEKLKYSKKAATKTRNSRRKLLLAASILVLFSLTWFGIGNKKYICENGSSLNIVLPDSSSALLNAGSELSYNLFYWNINRAVKLKGEGFFKVKKGRSFVVKTSGGDISVLGTSFNVYIRDNELKVFCQTGKVAVKQNKRILLTPGMACRGTTDEGLGKAYHAQEKVVTGWKTGQFWYKKAPLKTVFAELARQYNIKIIFNENISGNYTGYFDNRNLEEALEMICIPMQLNYRIDQNKIEIFSIHKQLN